MIQIRHSIVPPDEVRNLPHRRDVVADVPCSAEALFDSFGSAAESGQWLKFKIEWLDDVRQVGTQRTLAGFPLYATETFTEWNAPERFAFYFEKSSMLIVDAFGEVWEIEPTDDGCRFTWSLGIRMRRGWGWLGETLASQVEATIVDGLPELERIVTAS